jgi:hypothetical protein
METDIKLLAMKVLQRRDSSLTAVSEHEIENTPVRLPETVTETVTTLPVSQSQRLGNETETRPAKGRKKRGPTGSCCYDWLAGYEGLRLHCVTHQHSQGQDTVFRICSGGYDTLLEMLEQGWLTGLALRDAQRLQ